MVSRHRRTSKLGRMKWISRPSCVASPPFPWPRCPWPPARRVRPIRALPQPVQAPRAGPARRAASRLRGGTVAVALQEWAVLRAPDSVPAGTVTFQVTNTGPEDVHEFVVLKTDLDPD